LSDTVQKQDNRQFARPFDRQGHDDRHGLARPRFNTEQQFLETTRPDNAEKVNRVFNAGHFLDLYVEGQGGIIIIEVGLVRPQFRNKKAHDNRQ